MGEKELNQVEQLILELERHNESSQASLSSHDLSWLANLTDEQTVKLLQRLARLSNGDQAEPLLSVVLHQLAIRARGRQPSQSQLDPDAIEAVAAIYRQLPSSQRARAYALQLLSAGSGPDELAAFSELIAADPPSSGNDAAIAFGPLFQSKRYDPKPLFPRLLDALGEPAVASSIIDLANFVKRECLSPEHPAKSRESQLAMLLGELAHGLGRLEELPDNVDESAEELAERVDNTISLTVSLCDAMALIGARDAVGKLYQVLDLSHRRLRTEAAAALAKLGEEAGKEALLAMVKEPVTRLRVLAYADELDLADQIDEKYATPTARAEAELAIWLSQPSQLGIPPGELELIDGRTMFWPGYDTPIECSLFRFRYSFPNGDYENIGIAGPMCHAFAADLADLPPDDIYAAFAGWQAEHEEIFEKTIESLEDSQRVECSRLERKLRDRGYEDIQLLSFGSFFGDRYLVARGLQEGVPCICAVDAEGDQSFRSTGEPRSIGEVEVHSIYKGRKLLRSFNP